jgi:hypothetical protein
MVSEKIESGKSKIESERQIHLTQRKEDAELRRGVAICGHPSLSREGLGVSWKWEWKIENQK